MSTQQPPSAQPQPLGVGSVLADRYEITGVLGDGGMGAVYLAEHIGLRQNVAIKVLKPDLGNQSHLRERFFREARATAAVQHENIIDILDFGQTDLYAFFAMEALAGCELADLLRASGRLSWARAKPIIVQIARALTAAHQAGIVHRDMKPGNVFLINRGGTPDFVKVLDFGIAKLDDGLELTQVGMVFGTAAYMAPEQASGGAVDGRTDLYAVGCMVFEMLTGRVPFPGDNFMKVIGQHISENPPRMRDVAPIDAPAHLVDRIEALVAKTLGKFPEQRFADMSAFERAVLGIDGSLPPSLARGAPLPAELAGAPQRGYGGAARQLPPRTAMPGQQPAPAQPNSATQQQHQQQQQQQYQQQHQQQQVRSSESERRALMPIAYLFVAFAHGTDGVLTNEEMRALAGRLRRWAPQVGLDGIGAVLRDTIAIYRDSTDKSGDLQRCRAQLAQYLPSPSLAQLVVDLREIATADGRISSAEQRFVSDTAQAFGLEGDTRLECLAFMYLALGAATEGTVAPTEMKVLGEQLRHWAPAASHADTAAALRGAVDEYKLLAGVSARLERARVAAETLARNTDKETLRHVLADLWRIAGADGHISPEEQHFIMQMVERFKLA